MAIGNLDEEQFVERLNQHLRPSTPIDSFEHLYGREQQLEQIKQAFYSLGRHIFIYGDRGVGKTSLAKTAAYRHNPSSGEPIFSACGIGTTFVSILSDIVSQLITKNGILEGREVTKTSLGFKGASIEKTTERKVGERAPILDVNSAIDALKNNCPASGDRMIIVVDEFDQLPEKSDQVRFAEFIKQLGDQKINVTFIFCGIGKSLDELLTAHASSYRYLEGIELPRLNYGGRWEIVDKSSEALGVLVNVDSRFRIAAISDGFPHYIHLVCEKLYWHLFNLEDAIAVATPEHYIEAVQSACQSIESHLRKAYDKATMKDNDVYQEVLWALADHFELKRNVDAIYGSYLRIMEKRQKEPVDRKQFVSCLNNLKSPRHGSILYSDKRSWYEFSENMVRGYVRLRAEQQSVRLALEHEPAAEPKRLTVGPTKSRPVHSVQRPRLGADLYRGFGKGKKK